MKLRPVRKLSVVMESPNTKKESKKEEKSKSKLPKDTYDPMFEPMRFLVSEIPSQKDPSKFTKKFIEITVKRFDDYGLPYVFLQMYQEAEIYTGYLKGKSVHFPLEMLYEVIDKLEMIDKECLKRKIE